MNPSQLLEGQSVTRPPHFNGSHYSWWKNRMMNYIQSDDYELWVIIQEGPKIPMKDVIEEGKTKSIPKLPNEYTSDDYKMLEKNAKAMKMLYYGLGPDEYQRISSCTSAKEIWDSLSIAHEGTNQVKQSRIELLLRKYELFSMDSNESIHDMFTRFTLITNELRSLGKVFTTEELVRKVLRVLPPKWESKKLAIEEAKDLTTLPLTELLGNLQTYELSKDSHVETTRESKLALQCHVHDSDDESENEELALVMKAFKKFWKKKSATNNSSKLVKKDTKATNQGCFKCGKKDHFKRDCPHHNDDTKSNSSRRAAMRRYKKAMVAWGQESDSEEEQSEEKANYALVAKETSQETQVKWTAKETMDALMAHSDDTSDEEMEDTFKQDMLAMRAKVPTVTHNFLIKRTYELIDAAIEQHDHFDALDNEIERLKDELKTVLDSHKQVALENEELKSKLLMHESSTSSFAMSNACNEWNEKLDAMIVENQKLSHMNETLIANMSNYVDKNEHEKLNVVYEKCVQSLEFANNLIMNLKNENSMLQHNNTKHEKELLVLKSKHAVPMQTCDSHATCLKELSIVKNDYAICQRSLVATRKKYDACLNELAMCKHELLACKDELKNCMHANNLKNIEKSSKTSFKSSHAVASKKKSHVKFVDATNFANKKLLVHKPSLMYANKRKNVQKVHMLHTTSSRTSCASKEHSTSPMPSKMSWYDPSKVKARHGLGYVTKKYVDAPGDVLCSFCGQLGHKWENCVTRHMKLNKNISIASKSHNREKHITHVASNPPPHVIHHTNTSNGFEYELRIHDAKDVCCSIDMHVDPKLKPMFIHGIKIERVWVRKDQVHLFKNKGPNDKWVPPSNI